MRGRALARAAALRFGFKRKSNWVAKCLAGNERSRLAESFEPPHEEARATESHFAGWETGFAGLGFAADFWLSMGTSND